MPGLSRPRLSSQTLITETLITETLITETLITETLITETLITQGAQMPDTIAEQTTLPSELFMDIDRAGPIPMYFQVASKIEQAIADGTLAPGARLENEVALGERLGLSRPTVRRAIQELVAKGLLVRRRGIGTQVVQRPLTRKVELTSLYDGDVMGVYFTEFVTQ